MWIAHQPEHSVGSPATNQHGINAQQSHPFKSVATAAYRTTTKNNSLTNTATPTLQEPIPWSINTHPQDFASPIILQSSKKSVFNDADSTKKIVATCVSTNSTTKQILSQVKFSDAKIEIPDSPSKLKPKPKKDALCNATKHVQCKNQTLLAKRLFHFLALTYFVGVFLAGLVYHNLAEMDEMYLSCYLDELLNVAQSHTATLWIEQCIGSTTSLSLLLLLGLSALGAPFVPVVLFCKGMINGIILLKCYDTAYTQGIWYYIWTFGIVEAIFGTCLCLFGVAAMLSAIRMFRHAFFQEQDVHQKEKPNSFGKKYCFFMLLMMAVYACNIALNAQFIFTRSPL